MDHGLLVDIALCTIAAWVMAVAAQAVRQPPLLAYLVAGFAIGPQGLRWVTSPHSIEIISQLGLVLLLFLIGMEMDLGKMLGSGRIIVRTALAQILGCVALGWLFFTWIGPAHTWLEGLYLGVAAAMSSTVIIVKLLHDKRELETLAGRITVGVLVLQDLFVILFLAIQPSLSHPALGPLALALGKVALLIGVSYLVSRFVLPALFRFVARQPELVLVGALAWCFALAGLAHALGLSREMGALVAGVMVSTFPYTLDVVAKVTTIRDFFVTLFFVNLGMSVPTPDWTLVFWTLVVSLFVIGSRLVTVFPVLHGMRLGHRISLLSTIHLAQISELSLVLLAIGQQAGHVQAAAPSILTFAFALLAVDSTYALLRSDAIVRRASAWLNRAGLLDLTARESDTLFFQRPARIFILGFSWTASSLLEEITRQKPALLPELCVVDFNPLVVERLRARGLRVVYGDISQRDTLQHAGVAQAQVLICSLPDTVLKGTTNRKLLQMLRELNPRARILVHAEKLADVPGLYAAGADYVHVPRLLEAAELLRALDAAEHDLLDQMRKAQAELVEGRQEIIP